MTQVRHLRRAFTLVELVLSMAVMSILLGGLASAMIIATRAIPNRESAPGTAMESAYATEQLAGELAVAKTFSVRSPTVVEFKVDDRNNDGVDEVIRYEWSGTSGASLTRKYNSDAAVPVIGDVNEFALDYTLTPVTAQVVPGPTESQETLLMSFTGPGNMTEWSVSSTSWIGQYFKPTLPAGATSWKVTRVRIRAALNVNNTGLSRLQLRTADASNKPTSTIIDEAEMPEAELGNEYLPKELVFQNAGGLAPGAGMCLVLKWVSGVYACNVEYQVSSTSITGTNLVTTVNGGSSWTTKSNQSMTIDIYGTVTGTTTPTVATLYYLTAVRIRLRSGSHAESRAETSIRILNEPEIVGS